MWKQGIKKRKKKKKTKELNSTREGVKRLRKTLQKINQPEEVNEKKTFVAMDYSNKCQKLKIEKWVNRQIWKCIYTITALKQEKLKTKRKNEAFHKKLE